ncbi:MAG: hypothetical protein P1P82_15120 [Bacteroidales bacterium]|nr:hypothetical protein [Bacteroidales bacterium]MDT8430685.1 hypothetical protein [Bacteroidales bacterium]
MLTEELTAFIASSPFICGHNIIDHDKVYLEKWMGPEKLSDFQFIDTLFLSALLFPEKPYHSLVKDDKLDPENLNNPYTDATKARDLYYDEVEQFRQTDPLLQQIYVKLLGDSAYFKSFFAFVQPSASGVSAEQLIRTYFQGQCCENKALAAYANEDPVALAYTLALITCNSRESITPPWILHRFPNVERYLFQLRSDPCLPGCAYCNQSFDAVKGLWEFFGFPSFREFDGIPLQEQAVGAARDERIRADCYVLFNEDDLGKHFILLNQTKIDLHEISEIWKAVKTMTRERDSISNSALEIARKAGWNDQIETACMYQHVCQEH